MRKIDDRLLDLTFYPGPGPGPRGAVIVFPGGGYHVHAAHEAEPMARWLNRAGLPAFVLRYRLSPHRHPAPLEDAARAVRLVRSRAAEFGTRPDRIAVLGFSAGGHLATTLATHFDRGNPQAADPADRQSSRPDAVIAGYALTSLRTFGECSAVGHLLGDRPAPRLLDELSNELHVTAETPPAFLWTTADDQVVPAEQTLLYARALAGHGVPYELHVFPHGRHGLGLGDGSSFVGASAAVAQWPGLCEAWLRSLGF